MKHLLLSAMCLLPLETAAQEAQCLSTDEAYTILSEEYGEQRLVAGHNGVASSEFWINMDKPSWSLLIVSGEVACLVASGEDWTFDPIINKPNL